MENPSTEITIHGFQKFYTKKSVFKVLACIWNYYHIYAYSNKAFTFVLNYMYIWVN